MSLITNRAAALLAAAAGLLAMPVNTPAEARTSATATQSTTATQKAAPSRAQVGSRSIMQALLGGRSIGAGNTRYPRPGWPVATDRRMARKRRNVQRNRRAHRS